MKPIAQHRQSFFPVWCLVLFGLLLCQGCTKVDLQFSRPIVLGKTKDNQTLAIYDSRNHRFVLTDRAFKLRKIIYSDNFDSVWGGCFNDQDELVVPNSRYTKTTFNEEEKKAYSVVELLFYDLNGSLKHEVSWKGDTGPLIFPGQARLVGTDSYYITDFRLNNVVILNRKGDFIASFSSLGDGPGQIYYPSDLIETIDGNMIVADCYNSRLQLFDRQGKFLKTIAEKGTEEGQVMFPEYLCKDDQGNIYCTEFYTMRVSVFDKEYKLKKILNPRVDQFKDDLMELYGVIHLQNPEQVLVADSLNSRIYVFDQTGKLVQAVSSFTE